MSSETIELLKPFASAVGFATRPNVLPLGSKATGQIVD